MSSDVVPSGRSGNTGGIEAGIAGGKSSAAAGGADDDVGGAWEGGIGHAGVQAEADWVEACVRIAEDLVEIADSCGQLVGHRWGNDAVVDERVILNVDGCVLKVWRKVRGCWRGLCALADEPLGRQVVLVGDLPIELD